MLVIVGFVIIFGGVSVGFAMAAGGGHGIGEMLGNMNFGWGGFVIAVVCFYYEDVSMYEHGKDQLCFVFSRVYPAVTVT